MLSLPLRPVRRSRLKYRFVMVEQVDGAATHDQQEVDVQLGLRLQRRFVGTSCLFQPEASAISFRSEVLFLQHSSAIDDKVHFKTASVRFL